ncbi:hypothetical protein TNCV_558321 [Trichonephila clavipes]|nr:hypothetical protein TNCV_558321 [Trichonephila clavipes]
MLHLVLRQISVLHQLDVLYIQLNVVYPNVYYLERQITEPVFFSSTTCTVYENAWNKLWPDLEDEKDFNDDHRKENTEFVKSISEFQEGDEEDVETCRTCDAEDCGFQMLNDDEIVTSVLEESDPVKNETDEDEDNNNNESSKGPSNANAFVR